MSLSHKADLYEGSISDTDRKHRDYDFILALVCMVLALVVASAIFTPAPVGAGMDQQTSAVRIPLHPDVSLLAQCRRRLLC